MEKKKLGFSEGHYTSFHEDEHEWAKRGCPVCKRKILAKTNDQKEKPENCANGKRSPC